MPYLATPNTIMYYDAFEPNFTEPPVSPQIDTVLFIHGFGGTPESDFAALLPVLRNHFRVIAPHLHGMRDRIVPVEYAHLISKGIPNSQTQLFDAGHAAHLRCEDEYVSTMIIFF